jgi:hypothetical protein
MDQLTVRHDGLDGVQEAQALVVAIALHAAPQQGAVEHVPGGEERSIGISSPDRDAAVSRDRGQDTPGPPDLLLRAVAVRHNRRQTGTVT